MISRWDALPLQLGHVLSDMVSLNHRLEECGRAWLQLGHVLSDMVSAHWNGALSLSTSLQLGHVLSDMVRG